MSDGKDLNGFNETGEQSGSNTLDLNPTGQAPAAAFPATDKSSQGPAGVTNKMVHSVDETRSFGAGN